MVFSTPFSRPPLRLARRLCRYPLGFYDVAFGALDKAHDGFTILSGETKVIQRGVEVSEESLPVLFVDAHALVRGFHVASRMNHRAASDVALEIGQKLQLRFGPSSPRWAQKRLEPLIRHQAPDQVL